jgi:hypothetical protein
VQTHKSHGYGSKTLIALLAALNTKEKQGILEIHNEQNTG